MAQNKNNYGLTVYYKEIYANFSGGGGDVCGNGGSSGSSADSESSVST